MKLIPHSLPRFARSSFWLQELLFNRRGWRSTALRPRGFIFIKVTLSLTVKLRPASKIIWTLQKLDGGADKRCGFYIKWNTLTFIFTEFLTVDLVFVRWSWWATGRQCGRRACAHSRYHSGFTVFIVENLFTTAWKWQLVIFMRKSCLVFNTL